MNEDEITKLKLMICHLDLSVETKEKLYNQAHKIRNQLQQKENIIKEVREYIEDYINQFNGVYPVADMRYLDLNKILKILDKEKENEF